MIHVRFVPEADITNKNFVLTCVEKTGFCVDS